MDVETFSSLRLPTACKLLRSACCPDKDLVVLVSRLGGKDRLSLWKMQGAKTWEVDLGTGTGPDELVDLVWSPDGQTIAVAHHPPRVTLHSVQDGQEESAIALSLQARIVRIGWFNDGIPIKPGPIPDMFRRHGIVTGTAHSILKTLPLLDNIQQDNQKLTATDLFAFQGSQTRSAAKSSVPEKIASWPALQTDQRLASLSSTADKPPQMDVLNFRSMLTITDDEGGLYCFLDGSYPLGRISIGSNAPTPVIFKHPLQPSFFGHPQRRSGETTWISLLPSRIDLPFFASRKVRDFAQSSTTARELMWFSIRVVREMRETWFGSPNFVGARNIGRQWIKALETKQRVQFGRKEPNAMLDLTCLLVSGRLSDALADFLGSGEQISERGLQKWETTVVEALRKLRDSSEKQLAPAFQRLHLVLEEVHGWSLLPPYWTFGMDRKQLKRCLEDLRRGIIAAGWLAAAARRELARFKEFIAWIRFEITNINPTGEGNQSPHHDILEVNNYLISGLETSSLDRWFQGLKPSFTPQDLGIFQLDGDQPSLEAALEEARSFAANSTEMVWKMAGKAKDLTGLDRNLDDLVQNICTRAQDVFSRAADAASRSAVVTAPGISSSPKPTTQPIVIRQQISTPENKSSSPSFHLVQYLCLRMPSPNGKFLCFARMNYAQEHDKPLDLVVALIECVIFDEQGYRNELDLLDAAFFDAQSCVIVYRHRGQARGPAFIGTVTYHDLEYQELKSTADVTMAAQEDVMLSAIEEWESGDLSSTMLDLKQSRSLNLGESGSVSLAVNGRIGRRVACVLDESGYTIESLDLESDEELVQPDEA